VAAHGGGPVRFVRAVLACSRNLLMPPGRHFETPPSASADPALPTKASNAECTAGRVGQAKAHQDA
jgi:hypothetical protein